MIPLAGHLVDAILAVALYDVTFVGSLYIPCPLDSPPEKAIDPPIEPAAVAESCHRARPEKLGETLHEAARERPTPPAEAGCWPERPIVRDDPKKMQGAPDSAPHEVSPPGNSVHAQEAIQILMIEVNSLELVPHRVVV